jgi:DNA helicase II / ATP-dependent DNA helicase PcrA
VSVRQDLDLSKLLNPEQLRAATTVDGPLLILAGAGSGKTRVLVHRIAHLVASGRAQPWQIFAVTFTNKAAGQMRERLGRMLGDPARQAWIGTFHALSARLLRVEGHRLGYTSSFTIYDADDSHRLVKTILQDLGHEGASKKAAVSAVASEIDRAKNDAIGPETFREMEGPRDSPHRRAARRVYPKYQAALRRSNAMDFGDLLLCAVQLLQHHPEVHTKWADRFRYVLVDEFQDTNQVQYQFLRRLVEPHRNLAVVGDDDQAIYRWRGADVANILGFAETYPDATVVKLETNYRSTGNILAAANAVIRHNTRRHEKTLRTDAPAGGPVRLALVQRSEEEAELVARSIADAVRSGERGPGDFAILYRMNAQSRLFEEALMRERIPYVLVGGTGFYDRMEVKDVLAYLRVTANPASSGDFLRIVNVPTRGLGAKSVERMRSAGDAHGVDGAEILALPDEALREAGLSVAVIKKLRKLRELLEDLREFSETASATEVAQQVVERTGYLEHLERSDPHTAEDRAANVGELVSSIAEFEESLQDEDGEGLEGLGLAGARTPLQAFLDGAALVSPTDQRTSDENVTLMTLHSAKGLEFPVVFMVGMEERTFPSQRAVDDVAPEAMEEERRLCYVGMTRAREELCLTAARFRRIYGREEVRLASRFLGELPDGVVHTLTGAAGSAPSVESAVRPFETKHVRDGIEYDPDVAYRAAAEEPAPYVAPQRTVRGGTGELPPGARVWHNTFGAGTVVDNDGGGANARLTIDFAEAGRKRVVARFVRPA